MNIRQHIKKAITGILNDHILRPGSSFRRALQMTSEQGENQQSEETTKKTEEALRISENKFRILMDAIPETVYQYRSRENGKHAYEFVSRGVEALFEKTQDEVMSNTDLLWEMTISEDKKEIWEGIMESSKIPAPWSRELQIRVPSGAVKWIHCTSIPEPPGEDNSILWNGLMSDITDHKKMEESHRLSEERIRGIFYTANVGIAQADVDDQLIDVNPKLCHMLGYSREELLQMNSFDVVYPADLAESRLQTKVAIDNEFDLEHMVRRYVRKDSSIFWVEVSTNVIRDECGNKKYTIGVINDITERKQAEEVLQRYEVIVNATSDLMAFVDTDYIYRAVNQRFLDVMGISRNEIIGKKVIDIVGEDFFENHGTRKYFEKCFKGESVSYQSQRSLPGIQHDVYLDITFSPYKQADGTISGAVISSRDITELKKQSKLLLEAQKITHLGSFEYDLVKNDMYYSDELYRIYEIDRGQLLTYENFLTLVHPEDQELMDKAYTDSLINKIPVTEFVHRMLMADGRVKHIRQRWQILCDENDNPVRCIGTAHDVTEELTSERFLRRTQKMEAVGQLAGGIAHDFNNLLGIFQSNFELLQDFDINDENFTRRIDSGMKTVQRGASLTRRLLSFSKSGTMDTKVVSVNELLSDMQELLAKSLTSTIKIDLRLIKNIHLIKINTDELEDAIVNMALNARDAMPNGGKLVIETSNKLLDEDFVMHHQGAVPGKYVMLSINDSGSGMDQKTLEHVYEPFFTTKEKDKGTGLGLSMVYGFVKRNKGFMNIYSEPDHGTVVRLYLPTSDISEKQSIKEDLSQGFLPGGSETLLVVDDEKEILYGTQARLEALGYRILTANGGHEALEVINNHKGQIALILSDVVMAGGMNGYELAQEIEKRELGIRILLASGFTNNSTTKDDALNAHIEVLEKPYTKFEIATRVRKLLDKSE